MKKLRTFGEVLSDLRNELGYSQAYVGQEIGVTSQTISNYENGNTFPNERSLILLADFYDVSIDYLCSRTMDRKYPSQLNDAICILNETEFTLGYIYNQLIPLPADKRVRVAEAIQIALDYYNNHNNR